MRAALRVAVDLVEAPVLAPRAVRGDLLEGSPVRLQHRLLVGRRLPALDDDVAVGGVEFHHEAPPPGLLSADERRPAAAEEVEHVLPGLGRVLDRAHRKLDRLLGEVDHALGIHLLHRPDVDRVRRAEELVTGPFAPAVERPLVVTHEVLPREHRVFLHPDDGLAEVEAPRLERWRVVRAVRVAAPYIKGATRQQHAREVAEPGQKHLAEGLVGDEVVGERSVLRPHAPGRARARLASGEIESLMV